jgi:hypothetical protein
MATNGNYALRLPTSLMGDVRIASERDGTSINAFIVQAVAEKVAVLRARGMLDAMPADHQASMLAARAARAETGAYGAILRKAGTGVSLPGDELPDDGTAEVGGAVPAASARAMGQ